MKNNVSKPEETDLYPFAIEENMKLFYASRNEKDGRRYAGLEALKIGHGGRSYIADILGCSRHIVSRGAKEIVQDLPKKNRVSYSRKRRRTQTL